MDRARFERTARPLLVIWLYTVGTPIQEHPSSKHSGVKSSQLGMPRHFTGYALSTTDKSAL